jgi:electron transfer flavoprotein alpha subunit
VAAITTTSPLQMVTVRPGVLPVRAGRPVLSEPDVGTWSLGRSGRVRVLGSGRDDDVEALVGARCVVAVGTGVSPGDYDRLRPLVERLGAELAATRKVTDKGWLPRARQVGLTGHSVAPALYVAVGVMGKFNHIVGARAAGTIIAVNVDPGAPIFDWADVGITADWREALPALVDALAPHRTVV